VIPQGTDALGGGQQEACRCDANCYAIDAMPRKCATVMGGPFQKATLYDKAPMGLESKMQNAL
jgi:hypothetical protein